MKIRTDPIEGALEAMKSPSARQAARLGAEFVEKLRPALDSASIGELVSLQVALIVLMAEHAAENLGGCDERH